MAGRKAHPGKRVSLVLLFLIALVAAATAFILYSSPSAVFSRIATSTSSIIDSDREVSKKDAVPHVAVPDAVKAIYMSQCAVGTPSFRKDLTELLDSTELNAIVIDIRDYTGKISFPVEHESLKPYISDECGAPDMKEFIATLHEKNIYVIGRITVFQNPAYTKDYPDQAVQRVGGGIWKDNKGLAFVDVGAKPYWDTVVQLAKESYDIGFDEINFDYIRYPSDGPMKEAVYTWSQGKSKPQALEEFFQYLYNGIKDTGMKTSADLFGMTTTNTDDLNIGQVHERALPYFDFLAPMVYPSHYPKGFNGYNDVNANAYNIVRYSMREAVRRTRAATTTVDAFTHTRIGTSTPAMYSKPVYPASKMRPWLQDFDYPVEYTPEMVRAQIQASEEAGAVGYLFWDPSNKYSSLRQVVAPQSE